ncbi:ubiquitin-like protein Pup [Schaalia suimastitidis]|uniref:ubiquitin-like protein Pup n=1 Tax=Schaalia suimastitidis TaxID=121163 RepID=UPI000403FA71|nr:ubiquitin-like protein Pup [Schaalia suimastitidis]
MDQTHIYAGGPTGDGDEDFASGQVSAQVQPIDALLDEIDAVLETNAAAFVQGFVQKGGQ